MSSYAAERLTTDVQNQNVFSAYCDSRFVSPCLPIEARDSGNTMRDENNVQFVKTAETRPRANSRQARKKGPRVRRRNRHRERAHVPPGHVCIRTAHLPAPARRDPELGGPARVTLVITPYQ
ncbi:hypothetical protein Bbelb_264050 [Branchiostoma belcheri]|nr:hypothetical protein Bbelb_264050 [Branchiostoma belcheri]